MGNKFINEESDHLTIETQRISGRKSKENPLESRSTGSEVEPSRVAILTCNGKFRGEIVTRRQ